jgi:hypothetical protein
MISVQMSNGLVIREQRGTLVGRAVGVDGSRGIQTSGDIRPRVM